MDKSNDSFKTALHNSTHFLHMIFFFFLLLIKQKETLFN